MNVTISWGPFRSGRYSWTFCEHSSFRPEQVLRVLKGRLVSDPGFRENKTLPLFQIHTVSVYTHFLTTSAKKPYSLAPAHTYSACVSEYPLSRFRVKHTYSNWVFTRFATRVWGKILPCYERGLRDLRMYGHALWHLLPGPIADAKIPSEQTMGPFSTTPLASVLERC